jgi:hypothetical protein
MSLNRINGRVIVRDTAVGIPDLLVILHDVDPGTVPEEALLTGAPPVGIAPSAAASNTGIGDRIGSRLTDAQGRFEISYEDEEFRVRNPDEKRPDLLLVVTGPEEPGVSAAARVLFTATEIRQNAGRQEEYLIRISADALTKAGVPVPLDPALAREETPSVIGKMSQSVAHRADLDEETRKIAERHVKRARDQAQQTESTLHSRLLESLTGYTADEAARLNIVMPGAKPEPVVWNAINVGIDTVVNTRPARVSYLVLDAADAERFRDGSGGWRQDVPAAEIEPLLYRSARESDRPSFLLRTDPALAACRENNAADPFAPAPDDDDEPAPPPPSGDDPVATTDLPRFIGRLINGVIAPEQAALFAKPHRPDAADVQASIQNLQLKSGPADVAAFHDFYQLQIAFDYVWQQAIDEGVIETGKALCRSLIEQGGDPLPALAEGNPLAALRAEVRHVNAAKSLMQSAGVNFRTSSEPGNPGLGQSAKPFIIRPPFLGGIVGQLPTTMFEQLRPRQPHELLEELDEVLRERYKFEVFAPNSTNFGLMVTYRQKWQPLTYQVGELVKSLTLAPKETRKITSRRVLRKDRAVKELEENQRMRRDETSDTMRDEAEIVAKAQNKTNFSLTAKGSYDIGIADGDSTTSFTRDAESSSAEVKKAFREAVLKAAQEFKSERKLEVDTKVSSEEEQTEVSEIVNPNDELTVTYLFYELQRRYQVSESLHRLSPVVMVAMEVPNPNREAIDKIMLAHAWIINRALLDDRYRPALDYLTTRIVGDELALRELAANVERVRKMLDDMKNMHKHIEAVLRAREDSLTAAIEKRAKAVGAEGTEGLGEKAWESVFGSGDGEDLEAARIREDAAKEAYERSVREERDLRMRLDAETAALNTVTEQYAKAYAEHANRLLEVAGLRVHFKENVLYYMQAIWSYTFQDQIFFALAKIKVPRLAARKKIYDLSEPANVPLGVVRKPGQVVIEVAAEVQLHSGLDPSRDFVTLAEIADLDRPLGFKGNYMMFPLKQSNALTDFMMLPYLDSALGLRDPDDLGSWTPEDFARYARCVLKKLREELSPADLALLENELREQYRRIVSNPRMARDEVIVPTRSLYIEALPGAHPLLEDFKLAHRLIDVKRAQGETRRIELENLRYAARILGEQLDDPEIDKKIIIEGAAEPVVET